MAKTGVVLLAWYFLTLGWMPLESVLRSGGQWPVVVGPFPTRDICTQAAENVQRAGSKILLTCWEVRS